MLRGAALAALVFAAPAAAQDNWRDPAPHTAHYVTVARGVKLHYLDFGGRGPALIFLAGLGNTAHAWDTFAPAFTDRFRVIAITRRGFGESSHPWEGYETRRLVADILALMDSLHIRRASFVGHSIAGEELTRLAANYPGRVEKLVFLEGAYDRVRANDLIRLDSVPVPKGEVSHAAMTAADTATAGAYVDYVHRSRGVNIPDADIRTRYRYDGWNENITLAATSLDVETPPYRRVRAPALAVYAVNDASDELYAKLRAEFKSQVARGEVLELHGAHHWIFLSNRDEVLSATRRFLLR